MFEQIVTTGRPQLFPDAMATCSMQMVGKKKQLESQVKTRTILNSEGMIEDQKKNPVYVVCVCIHAKHQTLAANVK